MAKYRLEKNRKKSVNCEVLHENLNGYIVRFDNGMIKNVKKSNVYAFDKIDEAVLDDIRTGFSKFGRRVADVAKYVGNKIKNAFSFIGGTLFFMFRGKPVFANHPVNIMELAKESDNVGFIPSTSTVKLCDEIGVDVFESVYKFDRSGYSGSFDVNVGVNESMKPSLYNFIMNEDFKLKYMSYKDPDTGIEDPDRLITLTNKMGICDYPGETISFNLKNTYAGLIEGRTDPGAAREMPIIYGAPGIGKSTIVQNFAKELKKEKYTNEIGEPLGTPAVITINSTTIHSETFTLPAKIEEFLKSGLADRQMADEFVDRDTDKNGKYVNVPISARAAIQDLPKNWLPVYNSIDKTEKELELANAIANGGRLVKDAETGEEIIVNGPGGLFFLDEFSRMDKINFTSLMTIVTGGNLGNGLLFGDRWIMVGAANRNEDENDGECTGLIYNAALDGRVVLWNYVPDPNDWKDWALKKNKKTGRSNVLPEVVEFVMDSVKITKNGFEYSGNVGYYYFSVKPDQNNTNVDHPRATPRRWEMISNGILNAIPKGANLTKYLTTLKVADYQKYLMLMYTFEKNARAGLGSLVGNKFYKYLENLSSDITAPIMEDILKNGVEKILERGADDESCNYLESTQMIPSKFVHIRFANTIIPLVAEIRKHVFEHEAINLFDFAWYMMFKDMKVSKPGFSADMNAIVNIMRDELGICTDHESDANGAVPNEYKKYIDYIRNKLIKLK